jgi:hypothetical protein
LWFTYNKLYCGFWDGSNREGSSSSRLSSLTYFYLSTIFSSSSSSDFSSISLISSNYKSLLYSLPNSSSSPRLTWRRFLRRSAKDSTGLTGAAYF